MGHTMPDEFIQPNWHVMFIHFPLALLGLGVCLELLSFCWRKGGVRDAGRWMILMGALLGLPTVLLGVYAFRDVVVADPESVRHTWSQVVSASIWSAQQWQCMRYHIWLECLGTGLAALVALGYLAASDAARRRLYYPGLLLLVAAVGMTVVGAWYSGEMVYRHGTGVQAAVVQPASGPLIAAPAATAPAERVEADDHEHEHAGMPSPEIQRYLPPLQLHLLLVGTTISFALAGVALSARRWTQLDQPVATLAPEMLTPEPRVIHAIQRPVVEAAPNQLIAPAPPGIATLIMRPVYPARFWLAGLVFALLVVAGGLWMTGDWRLTELIQPIQSRADVRQNRLFFHVVFGTSIVVLLLIGTLLARFGPRTKVTTTLLTLLLLAAVAAQVWVGVLMLYDSEHGPLTGMR